MSFVLTVGALLAGFLVATGCAERRVTQQKSQPSPVLVAQKQNDAAIITEAPPPPHIEVVGEPPSPGLAWLPGHWVWQERWVWVAGRWASVPRSEALWIPGRWVQRDQGWVWIRGYWR